MFEKIFIFYKSSQCHFSNEDQEKVKILFKKEGVSLKRLKEVFFSRQALLEGLQSLGIDTKIESLQIHQYHFLEHFPDYLVSISHNPRVYMAALALKKNFFSIGIDIEFINRSISSGAEKFFVSNLDASRFNFLELWVMKEACYKALTPYMALHDKYKKNFTLKEIWINQNLEFGISSSQKNIGEVYLETIIIEGKEYLLAKSYILDSTCH